MSKWKRVGGTIWERLAKNECKWKAKIAEQERTITRLSGALEQAVVRLNTSGAQIDGLVRANVALQREVAELRGLPFQPKLPIH